MTDCWPTTAAARAEMDRERAQLRQTAEARTAEMDARAGSAAPSSDHDLRRSVARMEQTATLPWPHPDDVLAAALELRAVSDGTDVSADPETEDAPTADPTTLQLGEGAYLSALAHGAIDWDERVLVGFGTCYKDIRGAVDEVVYTARDGARHRTWVPAREFGLTADGSALYQALRAEGTAPLEAARMAALAYAAPRG